MELNLEFKEIAYDSPLYWRVVRLREIVLRLPLGMRFSLDSILDEGNEKILVLIDSNQNVIATNQFIIHDGEAKMRQVATKLSFQGKGIGRKLFLASQDYLRNLGIKLIYCHARKSAVTFYSKLGMEIYSEEFLEIGIPHVKMRKRIG